MNISPEEIEERIIMKKHKRPSKRHISKFVLGVTDDKDVKLIKTLINSYCHSEALNDNHKFSKSGIYI